MAQDLNSLLERLRQAEQRLEQETQQREQAEQQLEPSTLLGLLEGCHELSLAIRVETDATLNIAECLYEDGKYQEAEIFFESILKEKRSRLPEDHEDILTSMANLASTFRNQGRWTDAEQLEVQVMETRKTVLGPEHPSTLTSMNNLSHTLRSLGRHSEAVSILDTCVRLRQKRLGDSHPDTVVAVETLIYWQAEIQRDLPEDLGSDISSGSVGISALGGFTGTLWPPQPILPKFTFSDLVGALNMQTGVGRNAHNPG